MRLYFGIGSLYRDGANHIEPFTLLLRSEDEALGFVHRTMVEKYPAADGWPPASCRVFAVPDEYVRAADSHLPPASEGR